MWLWETNTSIQSRFCLAKPFSIPKPQIVFIQFHFLRIEALLGHPMGGDLLGDDPGTSHIVSPSSGVKWYLILDWQDSFPYCFLHKIAFGSRNENSSPNRQGTWFQDKSMNVHFRTDARDDTNHIECSRAKCPISAALTQRAPLKTLFGCLLTGKVKVDLRLIFVVAPKIFGVPRCTLCQSG